MQKPRALVFAVLAFAGHAAAQQAPCEGSLTQEVRDNDPGVTRTFLRRLRVVAPGVAWAVGDETTTDESRTVTLRYENGAWIRVPSPSPRNALGRAENVLHDIDATGADDVWAVGGFTNQSPNAYDTLALHWDGNGWEQVVTPGQSDFGAQGFHFEAVRAVGANDIWFGGQAAGCVRGEAFLVHTDGSGAFETHCVRVGLNGVARVRDIDALGSDDVWAVGAWGGIGSAVGAPFALHWDGSSWEVNNPPITDHDEILYAVEMVAPDDVWATGVYAQDSTLPLYWHWDGAGWTRFEGPAFALDLVSFATDDIYGVSGDSIVHWDGWAWAQLDTRFDPGTAGLINMIGIDALGPCDLLFAGHTLSPDKGSLAEFAGDGCPADFNTDGQVNTLDVLAFLNAWSAGDPAADFNADGAINTLDVLAFLNAWSAGC